MRKAQADIEERMHQQHLQQEKNMRDMEERLSQMLLRAQRPQQAPEMQLPAQAPPVPPVFADPRNPMQSSQPLGYVPPVGATTLVAPLDG